MVGRCRSSIIERLELVRLISQLHLTKAQAASQLGFSVHWVRKWWHRYRRGGENALSPHTPPPSGPLARFEPAIAQPILDYRRLHPLIGARRALVSLRKLPALKDRPLPSARTIHRAWVKAGLVSRRRHVPCDVPPPSPPPPASDPHANWQIDHQDHVRGEGLDWPVVLQNVRAPDAGITIGADVFAGPHGAHAVPEDEILDALRKRLAKWGKPLALSVDRDVRFFGQPQRQFPSRLELFCAGLHIAVIPIHRGCPTEHGAVERLHRTLDGVVIGPRYESLGEVQAALDEQVEELNEEFPSRAKGCGGLPPLVAHPEGRHSGRGYDPCREWEEFDLSSADKLLSAWQWHRQVGPKTGQISFADRNVVVGKQWAGKLVALRFDPNDRQVVVYEAGTSPGELGPEIKRFHCPAFDKETILGNSHVAVHPPTKEGVHTNGTAGGTPL